MTDKVNRRKFLKAAAAGAAGTGIAAPAIAQTTPTIEWRLVSSFPKSLDTIFGAGETFAKALLEMSDGDFRVRVFAPTEIVPGLSAADAVTNGSVEAAHTASYYYWGKDPTFALGTALPFGLNYRMQNAWMYQGGGIDLLNAFYARYKHLCAAGRQYRHADGRLVPPRDQLAGGSGAASRCASAAWPAR